MATIWELVEDALDGLGVPIAANAYIPATGSAFPDLYLVYFLVSSPPILHGDNAEQLRYWRVQVAAYSRDGLAGLPDIDGAMTTAGFSRGPQRELPYSPSTRHFGLALEYVYGEIAADALSV